MRHWRGLGGEALERVRGWDIWRGLGGGTSGEG